MRDARGPIVTREVSDMSADEEKFEYDVALSLRHGDLGLADEIKLAIDPPLRCFLYARKQEEIAGSDGLDTFRTVFRRDSRLNVVLYRDGWGKTPWTGVEEVAIKDACLRTKYRNLLWVRLDGAATPDWLPDTHQQFDLAAYPFPSWPV
jgi:hypothetical protein